MSPEVPRLSHLIRLVLRARVCVPVPSAPWCVCPHSLPPLPSQFIRLEKLAFAIWWKQEQMRTAWDREAMQREEARGWAVRAYALCVCVPSVRALYVSVCVCPVRVRCMCVWVPKVSASGRACVCVRSVLQLVVFACACATRLSACLCISASCRCVRMRHEAYCT